ncbi:MAG: DUF1841 family protein [Thiobacillaceae bacterium]|nr:DUF1841 family protein [Thiobacillaceae bacterium]MCX7673922.1 DUF1841 family protein [Thiobacillaceae bacterium]MDW8322466.1 DUF1841 family protein [Burkholderiales bacterium]
MFTPSREEARRFFIEAWRKHRQGLPLQPLEALAADLIARHPEYHATLETQASLQREWPPELGESNPFLHLGLHLAVAEQLSIDQPPGLRPLYQELMRQLQDQHRVEHAIMDCLAEHLWQTQHYGQPFDGPAYLQCIKARCTRVC